jgi:hypothetical protein
MASKENPGQALPFDPLRIGDRSRHYFAETVLVSAVFYLVLFGLLVLTEVTVPTPELVFIALVPFLVLLISSGRIQELRFGDISMKFQKAIQSGISPDVVGEVFDVEPEDVGAKGGEGRLDQMIGEQRSTLAFRVGGWYSADFIQRYLERNLNENPHFKYVLFTDSDERFRGLMKAEDFVSYVWLHDDEVDSVVNAIRSGDILDDKDVIKTRIQDGSTLGEAKRKFNNVDENLLAVVDSNEGFIGVLTHEEVNSKLLSRLMGGGDPHPRFPSG